MERTCYRKVGEAKVLFDSEVTRDERRRTRERQGTLVNYDVEFIAETSAV